ncbi:MAG TPA: cyanophycin synthetase, partial [Candidatus Omnitrophota bacterium]|nr:cyanophycin synthetase [Candidatus Omnitrophota bacterium]
FLCYDPTFSIITNIDHEHMDFYKNYDNLLASFRKFAGQTKKGGCIIYCFEDPDLKKIVDESGVRSKSFGYSDKADYHAKDIVLGQCRLSFSCFDKKGKLGEISLNLSGKHNILNVLAVIALGMELGLDFDKIKKGISGFRGVERRFQVKFEDEDILVVDDYGHHPTEISATIEAARACMKNRLVVVFQPHRYTRTQTLMDKFEKCFSKSDYLVITDIYAASEDPIPGINAEFMARKVREASGKEVNYVPRERIIEHLNSVIKKGDLVLFLGAGDITKASDEFTKNFKKHA